MSEGGWNTIDSDAGVFTELVEKLGVQDVEFNDLYVIDTDSLATLQPVHGVIFLFKYGKLYRQYASDGNKPLDGTYDNDYLEHDIFFAQQTINNACATQAALNVLFNVDGIDLGEELSNFRSFVTGFDSFMIGETISNSDLIRSVHNSFSTPSMFVDEDKPQPPSDYESDSLFHFVGYVYKSGRIYELDGLKSYPIIHEECSSQQEFIEKLPGVIQRRIAKHGENELRFSLLAVTNNKLEQARTIGDESEVHHQLHKREVWSHENELRKHDYTGLIVELLKNISKNKTDEEWEELLKKGRKHTQQLIQQRIAKSQL
ncbi:uncharacterized protein SPAPADRAFT_142267 [Spathaspora passalidarum NRRL Y-27907]|uniref:Ubiquitin carboxyl-terminal hydrolase n=1 Tax=Spathaspora passalidarum (strain NRRL Y-27907 / 11-Y1) TaxID=619300 RepID=G3ASE9_SPAPN|nr:uncharacterized protein SPAPADRAFT_142267 [Spathaspora passalidarum NRRL Y-27907]EGW31067.1 hypothetical protein SPAPADRAFT_142267 [Spathaspora passalidarum NRRL Y-27907]